MNRLEAAAFAEACGRLESCDLVAGLHSYGAVELSASHLVVWVLLNGPEAELPEWFFPPENDGGVDAELVRIRATVRAAYADAGWPDAHLVKVGFDSMERVANRGGRNYFRL